MKFERLTGSNLEVLNDLLVIRVFICIFAFQSAHCLATTVMFINGIQYSEVESYRDCN